MNFISFEKEIRMDSSCSAVLNGEFYIFGDSHPVDLDENHPEYLDIKISQRLIKKVENCGLTVKGDVNITEVSSFNSEIFP